MADDGLTKFICWHCDKVHYNLRDIIARFCVACRHHCDEVAR